jgi:hypothetical protein
MLAQRHSAVGNCRTSPGLCGPATPFELKLRHELDLEFRRMDSDWFLRWHNLNIRNAVVDVDRFDGGRIHTGGIVFEGQVQQIYWETVGRFLKQKIHATFALWKSEAADYLIEQRRLSLEGISSSLRLFVSKIIKHGVETDRRLRGRGYPTSVKEFNASRFQSAVNAEIECLRAAHLSLIPVPSQRLFVHGVERFFSTWPGIMTIVLTLLGIVVSIFF